MKTHHYLWAGSALTLAGWGGFFIYSMFIADDTHLQRWGSHFDATSISISSFVTDHRLKTVLGSLEFTLIPAIVMTLIGCCCFHKTKNAALPRDGIDIEAAAGGRSDSDSNSSRGSYQPPAVITPPSIKGAFANIHTWVEQAEDITDGRPANDLLGRVLAVIKQLGNKTTINETDLRNTPTPRANTKHPETCALGETILLYALIYLVLKLSPITQNQWRASDYNSLLADSRSLQRALSRTLDHNGFNTLATYQQYPRLKDLTLKRHTTQLTQVINAKINTLKKAREDTREERRAQRRGTYFR
jgi:hypothetical protein